MNARILNSIRFFIILSCLLGSLYAQERPLITQSPEVLEPGKVSLQFGFDFLQDVKYPASGLRGDQTSHRSDGDLYRPWGNCRIRNELDRI